MGRISIIAADADSAKVSHSSQYRDLANLLQRQGHEVITSWGFIPGCETAQAQRERTRADLFIVFNTASLLADPTYDRAYRPAVLKAGESGKTVIVNLGYSSIDYAPEKDLPLVPGQPIKNSAEWMKVNSEILGRISSLGILANPQQVSGAYNNPLNDHFGDREESRRERDGDLQKQVFQ